MDQPAKPSQQSTPKNFLDLPAELRIAIYELAAEETHLILLLDRNDPSIPRNLPPPGLFLASKQTQVESQPILLSIAHITVPIHSFDFSALRDWTQRLPHPHHEALASSPNLTIRLHLDACGTATLRSLHRWIKHRALLASISDASGKVEMPDWRYEVHYGPMLRLVDKGNVAFHSESRVAAFLEALSLLHINVEDGLKRELEPVIAAFERKQAELAKHHRTEA